VGRFKEAAAPLASDALAAEADAERAAASALAEASVAFVV